MSDANWGPQDASVPKHDVPPVDLWKSCSMSGHLLSLHGPLHWLSKPQTVTARSSAEAEIYATDKYVKDMQFITHIIQDLGLSESLVSPPVLILNNNMACVQWSKK